MLHYETIIRLHEAIRENKRIGVLIDTSVESELKSIINIYRYRYRYGCVYFENGVYKTSMIPKGFSKSDITRNILKAKVKEENGIIMYEMGNIISAIEITIEHFKILSKTVGEFTDLKSMNEIEEYLEKEKLDYVIFKEDQVWGKG